MTADLNENPFTTPTSELHEKVPAEDFPSIEEALARGYNFSVDGLINQAWLQVKGAKGVILAGSIIVFGLFCAVKTGLTMTGLTTNNQHYANIINQLIAVLLTPFSAGLQLIGIRRAANNPISINLLTSQFCRVAPLLITSLLMGALTFFGYLLLIIPGIYLFVAYMLAIPLVMERGLSPWQAMEASRKAITQHWLKVFGLLLTLSLMNLVAAIPLGIGLIWTIPLSAICLGALYRTIFGTLPAPKTISVTPLV
jgi:hypothetical protein